MHTSKFSLTSFLWQMLFAHVDEKICQIFIRQIKSGTVQFLFVREHLSSEKFARVDGSSKKFVEHKWKIGSQILHMHVFLELLSA